MATPWPSEVASTQGRPQLGFEQKKRLFDGRTGHSRTELAHHAAAEVGRNICAFAPTASAWCHSRQRTLAISSLRAGRNEWWKLVSGNELEIEEMASFLAI